MMIDEQVASFAHFFACVSGQKSENKDVEKEDEDIFMK